VEATIGLPPGQLHRDKPAALLCIAFVQAPPLKLALQGAQRQTVIPAKLVLSQSIRFKFRYRAHNHEKQLAEDARR
jgi:hypothetical protein